MEFVTIEELAALSKLNRRSVDRRLRALKLGEPEKYNKLVVQDGKKLRYDAAGLLGYMTGKNKIIPPLKPSEPTETQIPVPEPLQHKIRDLTKRRRKKHRHPKMSEIVGEEILNDDEISPKIIAMDEELRKDYKKLELQEQRLMLNFSAAMSDYETGLFTLYEALKKHNVNTNSFYKWIDTKPLFATVYAKATARHKKAYNTKLYDAAKQSLLKMIEGYDKQLNSTTYMQKIGPDGKPITIPVEHKTQTKHVIPNANLIMFAMFNRDPLDWKRIFIPGSNEPERPVDPLEQKSNDELLQYIMAAKEQGLLDSNKDVT